MKRIKHNDLTHYFLRPHSELPQAYLASCEKFFRELKNLKLARLTATNVQKKRQASSSKQCLTVSVGFDRMNLERICYD